MAASSKTWKIWLESCQDANNNPQPAKPSWSLHMFFAFLGLRDRSETLQNGPGMLRVHSGQTVILDPICVIFDDLRPNRHFGSDLDFQKEARVLPEVLAPANTFLVLLTNNDFFPLAGGDGYPSAQQEKVRFFFAGRGSDPRSAFLAKPEIPIAHTPPNKNRQNTFVVGSAGRVRKKV